MGLFDAVLIKDNHLASRGDPLDVASAVTAARAAVDADMTVQVEVDTLEQLANALDALPDMVLLDNMTTEQLARAVEIRNQQSPAVLLEASGGITLESLAEVAAAGVDRISLGTLTHSVPNWDVGFDWVD
jgi:nicotinate-nucleotide pyrophosphorylase (carboxylating)